MMFICRPDGRGLNLGQRNTAIFLDFVRKNPNVPWKLTPVLPESNKQRRFLEGAGRALKRVVRSDALASAFNQSVIPRDKPRRVLQFKDKELGIQVDNAYIKQRLREINSGRSTKFSTRSPINVESCRHCFGHLVDAILCNLVRQLMRLSGQGSTVNDHAIRSMAIVKFGSFLKVHPHSLVARHYESQFGRHASTAF